MCLSLSLKPVHQVATMFQEYHLIITLCEAQYACNNRVIAKQYYKYPSIQLDVSCDIRSVQRNIVNELLKWYQLCFTVLSHSVPMVMVVVVSCFIH